MENFTVAYDAAADVLTITKADGSTVSYVNSSLAGPIVAPEDVEVDLLLSDGSTKKFVPAA
jgi:hypothetical protein